MTSRAFDIRLTAGLLLLGATAVAAPHLASSWPTQPIKIDGSSDEWAALTPLEDTRISIGVQNDRQYVYLTIVSSDQARRQQLLTDDLIVWLDAAAKKKHTFGIRVPGVFLGVGRGGLGRRAGAGAESRQGSLPEISYFEIVGPKDDDRRRIERTSTRAIQVDRAVQEGALTIELQIPLATSDGAAYAIGARAGQVIDLGLETRTAGRPEELPPDARGRGGRAGMGGGGRGGRGRMGSGRGPGTGRMERAGPLKVWTTVQLATSRQ